MRIMRIYTKLSNWTYESILPSVEKYLLEVSEGSWLAG